MERSKVFKNGLVVLTVLVMIGVVSRSGELTPPDPTPTQRALPFDDRPKPTATRIIGTIAEVVGKSANLRSGPGMDRSILYTLDKGELVIVHGRNADSTWIYVEPGSGLRGWVSADLLDVWADFENIPVTLSAESKIAPRPTSSVIVVQPENGKQCPKTCDECKARGWSAKQCATCPGLDRDKDGVACYGE